MIPLAFVWISLGLTLGSITRLGFQRMLDPGVLSALGGRLPLKMRVRVLLTVPLWPIGLASTVLVNTGHPGASGVLERIAFGWADAACDWWLLRQISKLPQNHQPPL
jgi:hypothetical protein